MAKLERFYNTFQPDHYDVFIDINRAKKTINGKTTITGNATDPQIAINQKNLQVTSVQAAGQELDFNIDNDAEAVRITLPQTGKVTFTVTYNTKLTDSMMGIYPSYYEVNGEKQQIIGTQFETTFARQAFPCVDEPEAKATFSLAIKFDEHPGETIITNMPENHIENGIHYFEPTVRMSTYLVAFAFGELQSKITETKGGVKVGVFATKAHQPKELDFALDIAKRAIEFYEDFYQTPYPLPHSWQLALPDFSAGAMENWGLVTYREAYLLLDPDNTSLEMKQLVATVITHELAHQWFGDLVTMKWWDDLWLNESFANMMEYVAVDALQPDWHIWELFQTSEAPMALQRDATDGVQSVHVDVNNPAEIDALFDGAIVYAKGSRMLVMVRALLGDRALREGLKNYFAAHKYSNATGADLWKALGDASGLNIGKIMNSWLEQPGYPVVTAKINDDGDLVLSQKQFFIGDGKDVDREWQIPLNSNYDKAPQIMAEQELNLGNYQALRDKNGQPFRLNLGNNSHFIVKYDDTLLNDILDHADELDPITQRQLLQDLRLLAQGQQTSYASLIPLLKQFKDSPSAIVNAELYQIANSLKMFAKPDSPAEQELRQFFDLLSKDQVKRLGWLPKDGESNDDQLTRPYILSASLFARNNDSITQAHQIFTENQDKLESLSADIRGLVLKNEVQNFGSAELFDKLIKAYQQTADASFKQDLRIAIPNTTDPALIAKVVSYFEDADVIKPQDLRAWYRGLLANQAGQQAAWNWLRDEWQWLNDTVGGDMEFATFITVTAGVFHTPERLNEFKDFFEPKLNTPGLTREIKMDISVIESKVNLINKEQTAVNDAITQQ
ncbi:M1 family metallopeptidase [Limosilactobacillus reuteri]|uniref:M1 family metallopeptidase n=1 Tax=Limosilactobacillus reuteri TaxID=1598 RepID=UPI001E2B93E1|nr:M1 family metallopeptidase [Limosilactobacillus reuteri]MCC4343894.1 M1 family metallopeptidase [Limosilactobacillus reuteri]MCC4356591.1 M1 family metallopeptidase [Limosilactobacillus reuteri]WJK30215.1 M1 family metallopeptidase [Limosilactobacillus reuteri]WLR78791.1 M1 family metallopeptidase [Limosilactobacillus reuteri]